MIKFKRQENKLKALILAALIMGLNLPIIGKPSPAETKPLNILFIFMEDMGLQIPAYGDNTAPTPGIDKLASTGVLFENAYCVQATCSSSRSSVYSGQYPHQTGHMGLAENFGYYMKKGFITFLSQLKESGYRTGYSYKIHVSPENQIAKYYDVHNNIPKFKKDGSDTKDYNRAIKYFDKFLKESKKGQPFFYMAQTHDTHEPFNRGPFKTAPDREPYRTLKGADVKALPAFGEGLSMKGYLSTMTASYYNSIQRVDAFVSGCLSLLEKHGLDENTVVIFSSDHGPSFARGKLSCNELGLRVPLIVRWPGTQVAGTRNKQLISLLDIAPTLVDVAGRKAPKQYEGQSLKDFAMTGATTEWRNNLFSEYTSHTTIDYWPMRSVRNDRYKMIVNKLAGTTEGEFILTGGRVQSEGGSPDIYAALKAPKGSSSRIAYEQIKNPPPVELYDLKKDPYELNNLAESPEHQATLKELSMTLTKWEVDTQDPFADPVYFKMFTQAQITKQKSIRKWEQENTVNGFWGKAIAKGNWKKLIEYSSDKSVADKAEYQD